MKHISLSIPRYEIDGVQILGKISLMFNADDRIAMVGPNGAGKTTLMKVITGEIEVPDAVFENTGSLSLGYLSQIHFDKEDVIVKEELRLAFSDILRLESELEAAEAEMDAPGGIDRYTGVLERYHMLGGYDYEREIDRVARGLGIFDLLGRSVKEVSGGQRTKIALAKVLLSRPEFLFLDEPTNFIDLASVEWLEDYLNETWKGGYMIISHDREFLDAVVGRILSIRDRRITSYTGNYSAFEDQQTARAAQARASNERLRRESEHIRSFVERFRAKASKAKQAQSRLKWLERLPAIMDLREEESFEWAFAAPRKLPRPLVALDRAAAGYGSRTVVGNLGLSIAPEARIGILGRNGAGKSTLMKLIAGETEPLAGTRTASPELETGFFAQLEVDQLDPSSTAILELTRRGGTEAAGWLEQQKRDHLGRFGFRGDRVFDPVGRFSGGERARLSLAILVARRPNLLLLDEPTNHLDFEMRESLLLALQDFTGAVVVVSHDRSLLRGVCDEFLLVADGRAAPFEGDLDDYAAWLGKRQSSGATEADSGSSGLSPGFASAADRRELRRREAEARNQLAPLRAELRTLEKTLAAQGERRSALEARLADPDFYSSTEPAAQRALLAEHGKLLKDIDTMETRWLELSERLEAG
jgi:ATP-binding cassette subfamily F protein 3